MKKQPDGDMSLGRTPAETGVGQEGRGAGTKGTNTTELRLNRGSSKSETIQQQQKSFSTPGRLRQEDCCEFKVHREILKKKERNKQTKKTETKARDQRQAVA